MHSKNKTKPMHIMKKLMGTTLCASLMVGTPVLAISQAAQAATAADDITAAKRLNNLLKNTRSMTANFTQTTTGASGGSSGLAVRNGTFTGTVSLQRPNKFRWQTKSPYEQLIVADGTYLWVYDKSIKQVTRQKADQQLGNTPALLLSGDPSKIAQNFKITQPNAGIHYYVLYPKSSNNNFKSLSVSFSGGKPKMMVLKDSLGRVSSIKFDNTRLNPSISSSKFKFTPPQGVDVINQ